MRRIRDCLNPQLIKICENAMVIEALQLKISHYLPSDLHAHCRVASLNHGCLILIAPDAHWATLLRFAIPKLRDQLRQEAGFYQLSSIKIHLEVPVTLKKPALKAPICISQKARETMQTHQKMCHYPPLQKALEDLISHTNTRSVL